MSLCQDCTHIIKKTNRLWTVTCLSVALLALGSGFILGQMSTLC